MLKHHRRGDMKMLAGGACLLALLVSVGIYLKLQADVARTVIPAGQGAKKQIELLEDVRAMQDEMNRRAMQQTASADNDQTSQPSEADQESQ